MDFIRRNFPAFNPSLMPWESASKLYLNIDNPDWRRHASDILRARRSHVLLKSHLVGRDSQVELDVRSVLNSRHDTFLCPFRSFSSIVKSYAEFTHSPPPINRILTQKDRFLGLDMTVAQSIRHHAESWMKRDAHFFDCDLVREDPETASTRLSALLRQVPANIRRRLPRRKVHPGKIGELIERLSGRQSTEVLIRYKLHWQSRDERLFVENEFSDLHAELVKRRIN